MNRLVTGRQFRVAIFAAIILLVAGAACSRGDEGETVSPEDITINMTVEPEPPTMGPATITFVLTDKDGDPVSGATLEIEGNMTHAGMQPVFDDITEVEDGRYVTQNFQFTMGGDWIITVSGSLEDGAEIKQTFDLAGVEG
jgi:hypothetical protein